MFNDWALVWGEACGTETFPSFCAPAKTPLLIHQFCILRRPTWKWGLRPQGTFIRILLSAVMCFISWCNSTDVCVKHERDVKPCGKEQQSRQNDLKSRSNSPDSHPLAHARSVHLLPLSRRFIRAWRDGYTGLLSRSNIIDPSGYATLLKKVSFLGCLCFLFAYLFAKFSIVKGPVKLKWCFLDIYNVVCYNFFF